MAVEVAKLIAKLEADVADFDRDMKKATGRLDQLEDKAGKAGKTGQSAFSGMGGAVKAFATGAAVYKTVQFFKDTIDASSDLNESINAVNVTFGDAADGILELGENAATAVGLSNAEFNSLAVGFSAFVEKIDGGRGQVVDIMGDLTTRIADFASVMNLDVPEAAEKFRSGLAGETEPLRQFGIDVSAAAVNAKALELGLGDASGALSEQDKILARYNLIMEQTSKTAGDFANTSDQLANSQRILKAEFENAKAEIGDALTPVMTSLMQSARDLLPAFKDMAKSFADLIAGAQPLVDILIKGLGKAFDVLGTALAGATGNLDVYSKAQETFLSQHGREAKAVDETIRAIREEAQARYWISDALFATNAAREKAAEGIATYIRQSDLSVDQMMDVISTSKDLRVEHDLSADGYVMVVDALKETILASEDLTDVQRRDLAKALGVTLGELQQQEPQLRKVTEGYDEAGTSAEELAGKQKELERASKQVRTALDHQVAALDELDRALREQVDPAFAAVEAFWDYEEAANAAEEAARKYGEGSQEAVTASYEQFRAFDDLIAKAAAYAQVSGKDLIDSIREMGRQMGISDERVQAIIDSLNVVDGFVANATIKVALEGSWAAKKALEKASDSTIIWKPGLEGLQHGGPVMAQRPYIVGEAGPELFVPGTSGRVVANGDMPSGGTVVVNVHGSVMSERDLTKLIEERLYKTTRYSA